MACERGHGGSAGGPETNKVILIDLLRALDHDRIEKNWKASTSIEPWLITGSWCVGGWFTVSVLKSPTTKSGWCGAG